MPHEARPDLHERLGERDRVDRDRSRKAHVMLGDADRERRREHDPDPVGRRERRRLAHRRRDPRVDVERQVRPVLLGRRRPAGPRPGQAGRRPPRPPATSCPRARPLPLPSPFCPRQQPREGCLMPDASAHPYIPNSVPRIKEEMLEEIGVASVDELYARDPGAPAPRPAARPPAGRSRSEVELRRHLEGLLGRNDELRRDALSFLGGGCWQHYVPAVVRRDRRTAASSSPPTTARRYADHGKFQALFEFASLIGELVELRRGQPADLRLGARPRPRAICMAGRAHRPRRGARARPRSSPERRSVIAGYCGPWVDRRARSRSTRRPGSLDLDALRRRCSATTSRCVYVENPGYLGTIETRRRGDRRARRTRRARSPSSASTRSRSACSRRRRATAPTSSAASCSRSASTCTTAAGSPASSRRRTRSATSPSTRRS